MMRIVGHGIDLVDIARLKRLEKKGLLSHWLRAFSSLEEADAGPVSGKRYLLHLASNFAVKEATLKAAGGTPSGEIDWKEIEVTRTHVGQPLITTSGAFATHCRELGISSWIVSISRSPTHALGSVIALAD